MMMQTARRTTVVVTCSRMVMGITTSFTFLYSTVFSHPFSTVTKGMGVENRKENNVRLQVRNGIVSKYIFAPDVAKATQSK